MNSPSPVRRAASRVLFAEQLGSVRGLVYAARDVLTDLLVLEASFADPVAYDTALLRIADRLAQIVAGSVVGEALRGSLDGWNKDKLASDLQAGSRLDLRIVFRRTGSGTHLLGFGHRDHPWDVYGFVGPRAGASRP